MNNSYESDKELKQLLKKGVLEVPHTNLEDKIMQKLLFASERKLMLRKNLRASWIFLVVSVILFPLMFFVVTNHSSFSFIPYFGDSIPESTSILLPAGVLLFSIIILLQIDNLIRLSYRGRIF